MVRDSPIQAKPKDKLKRCTEVTKDEWCVFSVGPPPEWGRILTYEKPQPCAPWRSKCERDEYTGR